MPKGRGWRDAGKRAHWRRNARAAWRDTLLLLRQFAGALLLFALVLVGGGLLYFTLARRAGQPLGSLAESIYGVLGMTFLQPLGDFPDAWYLQLFYFVMPVVGIAVLATGLADFGTLFFNRRARRKEWEMAVASTFSRHVILVGLGHLGFRVMDTLVEMEQDVVVIEQNVRANLVDHARRLNVPVIHDDAQRPEVLAGAGVARARAIVLCTQNDVLNLQVAFKARRLNPDIDVVIRIFDDQFAQEVAEQFGYRALSATGMAAPSFAAAASGIDIARPITVEGQSFSLATLTVGRGSRLAGLPVGAVERDYNVSVVLLRHDSRSDHHPAAERVLAAGDVVGVLGEPEPIGALARANQPIRG